MAKTTVVTITDDIDGSEGAETVSFSFDGQNYEIDLGRKNHDKFRKGLQPFIDSGRRVGRQGSTRSGRRGRTLVLSGLHGATLATADARASAKAARSGKRSAAKLDAKHERTEINKAISQFESGGKLLHLRDLETGWEGLIALLVGFGAAVPFMDATIFVGPVSSGPLFGGDRAYEVGCVVAGVV